MTAPRTAADALAEIKERVAAADAEMTRLTSAKGGPGASWRWSIPADPTRDSDLIFAASLADNDRLVAAVEAVLDLHKTFAFRYADGSVEHFCDDDERTYPCLTVDAIARALDGTS